jgi:hypothetical protein
VKDNLDAVPAEEAWLHTPEMKAKLAAADAWMKVNPPQANDHALMALMDDMIAGLERMDSDPAFREAVKKCTF